MVCFSPRFPRSLALSKVEVFVSDVALATVANQRRTLTSPSAAAFCEEILRRGDATGAVQHFEKGVGV